MVIIDSPRVSALRPPLKVAQDIVISDDPGYTRLPDDLLRVTEVARRLGMSVAAVRSMLRDGSIPGIKVGAGLHWRVRESALVIYQNAGTRRPE